MIAANRDRNRQLAAARKAERQAQADEAARVFRAQVQPGFKPPVGRLWAVNVEALLIVGPAGAIGTTAVVARVLTPLAAGGRHDEARIATATGCRDTAHLRDILTGIAGKLAAIGLRVDWRKAGIRVGKVKREGAAPSA